MEAEPLSSSATSPARSVLHSPSSPKQPSSTLGDGSPPSDDAEFESIKNTSPEPVFLKSIALGVETCIPAIRITKHNGEVGYFPLSRIELGEVWWKRDDIDLWEVLQLQGDWHTALTEFKDHVDYPVEYLLAILGVFRSQTYMNNTPFRWSLWKRASRSTNTLLYASVTCNECHVLRSLSMRTLYTTSKHVKSLSLSCKNMNIQCRVEYPHPIESLNFTNPSSCDTSISGKQDQINKETEPCGEQRATVSECACPRSRAASIPRRLCTP